MKKSLWLVFLVVPLFFVPFSCQNSTKIIIDKKVISSFGKDQDAFFGGFAEEALNKSQLDPNNAQAHAQYAENKIIQYIFGFQSRENTIPGAKEALSKAYVIDSLDSEVLKIKGALHFLDREWKQAEYFFHQSINKNPENLNARHWLSQYLAATEKMDEALAQHDTIKVLDKNQDYLIGRGSLYYFQQRWEELRDLMLVAAEKSPDSPWAYDWLGMAYNGLKEHDLAISTYLKAFELSDGSVEVGGGLGHALGDAGDSINARFMTDFYDKMAEKHYLPPCQRSFIHVSLGEYDKALELLEQAYEEKSWFLIFMQIEHWYDPIREDERFQDILEKMNFPK